MEAQIKVAIKTDEKKYEISLGIPAGTIGDNNPCQFSVQETDHDAISNLLNVAVGGGNHFYVNVSPPKSILPENTIENLSVLLQEGNYKNGTFIKEQKEDLNKSLV